MNVVASSLFGLLVVMLVLAVNGVVGHLDALVKAVRAQNLHYGIGTPSLEGDTAFVRRALLQRIEGDPQNLIDRLGEDASVDAVSAAVEAVVPDAVRSLTRALDTHEEDAWALLGAVTSPRRRKPTP